MVSAFGIAFHSRNAATEFQKQLVGEGVRDPSLAVVSAAIGSVAAAPPKGEGSIAVLALYQLFLRARSIARLTRSLDSCAAKLREELDAGQSAFVEKMSHIVAVLDGPEKGALAKEVQCGVRACGAERVRWSIDLFC